MLKVNRFTKHQKILMAVATISIIGMCFALLATLQTIQIQKFGLENSSSCAINAWINCDVVQASTYALFVGVPVAWWGLLYYLWISITVIWATFMRHGGRSAVAAAFFLSMFALIFTFYKAYNLIFQLKVLCPLCLAMYIANFAIFLLLGKYLGVSLKTIPKFLWEYLRKTIGQRANLDFSPHTAFYFSSIIVLLASGITGMKYFEEQVLQMPKLNVKEEVTRHFLQPTNLTVIDVSSPMWGSPEGSISVVEFSDFQCPACRFAASYLRNVLSEFQEYVQLYFVNFPLDKQINPYIDYQIHEWAGLAARAATCAQRQNDFWEFHDEIFQQQNELNYELIMRLVAKRGWDLENFEACMNSEESFQRVREDIEYAHRANVNATPTIIINGRQVKYWNHPEILRAIIREELKQNIQNANEQLQTAR